MYIADKVHQLMSLLISDKATFRCVIVLPCMVLPVFECYEYRYSIIYKQSVGPDNLAQSSLYTCTLNIINTVPPKSSSHLHN